MLKPPKQMPFIEEIAIRKKDCQSQMEKQDLQSISSFTEGTKPRQASLASPKAGPIRLVLRRLKAVPLKKEIFGKCTNALRHIIAHSFAIFGR